MKLSILKPKKALNKAYLKVKPIRTEIEVFKKNLIDLLDNSNETESEEFHKNLVADFLKNTYYGGDYFINTKGRNDLVIHNGSKAKNPVGVIIEAKKPTNKSEMVSADKPNTKALQELVLYYLRERIQGKNLEVKKLIITNIYEWFIFDANEFEKYFAQNKALVKQFEDFENGSLSGTKTDFFYKEIAAPAIEAIQDEISCTYFDFRKYEKPLRNTDLKDDVKLIALFKLLSPEHLLKKPFTNDSNSLDKKFYAELLHIIGLSEQKEGGKKVIERNKPNERHTASLLEDTIIQLDSMDKISRLDKPSQFGTTQEERLFNVGLELSITWVNRILFLKLLEAQLITYHDGDKKYAFLNYERINNYDDLNSLFFQVLAKKYDERNADVIKAFEHVPYLNSSLFEPTEIEHNTLFVSNLRDDKEIPILDKTVLKDAKGKRRTGKITTLQYLFDFLNAYDFSGEGSENIQEDNKTLINASVLGLIFEKINGYKDGSFFTPGFITMYMCRETIRKAVVQKFNEAGFDLTESNPSPPLESLSRQELVGRDQGGGTFQDLNDIYNAIGSRGAFSHQQANELINDVKICDPAVGSGHFLVSALNEMIAVKHELGVLHDREGKLLRDYDIAVENDELIITDHNGELFEYNPKSKESQRVQETLFHEKQTIIENCLFGVDINPNSVKICRLRLWIELLKSAYYKNETELETLPNIDINIKCGNSLISRFDLDTDLKKALRNSKWNMDGYRIAVQTYRNAESKEQKREMERLIADIKGDFQTEISRNTKEQRLYDKYSAELYEKHMAPKLFEEQLDRKAKSKLKKEREKLEIKVTKLKEQLDDEGNFVGFDVVIGNPPYMVIEDENRNEGELQFYKSHYFVASYKIDLYYLFFERSINVIRYQGFLSFITPSNFITNNGLKDLRKFMLKNTSINSIVNISGKVFEEASVDTALSFLQKTEQDKSSLSEFMENYKWSNKQLEFTSKYSLNRQLIESDENLIFSKQKSISGIANRKVKDFYQVKFGMQLRNRKIFTEDVLINPDEEQLSDSYKQCYVGKDIKKYLMSYSDHYCFAQLEAKKGGCWDFDVHSANPKIIIRQIGEFPMAAIDTHGRYCLNAMFMIVPIKNESMDNVYELLGILNSKLIKAFWLNNFSDGRKTFPKIKGSYLELIPLPDSINNNQLRSKVQELLKFKQSDPTADTTALEQEIDELVYELYGLTEEEIEVVEGS